MVIFCFCGPLLWTPLWKAISSSIENTIFNWFKTIISAWFITHIYTFATLLFYITNEYVRSIRVYNIPACKVSCISRNSKTSLTNLVWYSIFIKLGIKLSESGSLFACQLFVKYIFRYIAFTIFFHHQIFSGRFKFWAHTITLGMRTENPTG